jgi:hypothetical protein
LRCSYMATQDSARRIWPSADRFLEYWSLLLLLVLSLAFWRLGGCAHRLQLFIARKYRRLGLRQIMQSPGTPGQAWGARALAPEGDVGN